MASKKSVTYYSLWDKKSLLLLFKELHLSNSSPGNSYLQTNDLAENDTCDDNDDSVLQSLTDLAVATKMACSVCSATFESRQKQVLHFKLDWHCENLKRREQGQQPISEEEFKPPFQSPDDASSSSSSPSSSETDDEEKEESITTSKNNGQRLARIFFENGCGDIFSAYKCLVLNKKKMLPNETEVVDIIKQLPERSTWAVLILGGGHFAAGIFKENEVIVHKTFHRYVTRAKQGTSQSIHDQHSKHAKSAGANLRRHNEMALVEEIKTLLQSWSEHLNVCNCIFYRATGHNKRALFGKHHPLFLKDDIRLRNIPFPTKRASFQEVVRVHTKLSTILCYGKVCEWEKQTQSSYDATSSPKGSSSNKPNLPPVSTNETLIEEVGKARSLQDATKSTNSFEKPLLENCNSAAITTSEVAQNESNKDNLKEPKRMSRRKKNSSDLKCRTRQETPLNSRSTSCDSSDTSLILEVQDELIDLSSLCLFEATKFKPKTNTKIGTTQVKRTPPISELFGKEEHSLRNSLYTACKVNDVSTIQGLLLPLMKSEDNSTVTNTLEVTDGTSSIGNPAAILRALNSPFGDTKTTLLHISSQCGFNELLWLLLESGADPAVGDIKGRPPYVLAVNKDTRNIFRRFMSAFPVKYDYVKAQIPSPLSEEAEKARVVKQQQHRQQKRQRAKAVKAEDDERSTFLRLSDLEKKACTRNQPAKLRCFLCGDSLKDKVPFEYNEFKFCTVKCLQQHRRS